MQFKLKNKKIGGFCLNGPIKSLCIEYIPSSDFLATRGNNKDINAQAIKKSRKLLGHTRNSVSKIEKYIIDMYHVKI